MEVFIEDCSKNGTFILPKNDDQYVKFEEKQQNRQIIRLKKGEPRLVVRPMLDEIYLVNPSLETNNDLLEKVSFVVHVFSRPFPGNILLPHKVNQSPPYLLLFSNGVHLFSLFSIP